MDTSGASSATCGRTVAGCCRHRGGDRASLVALLFRPDPQPANSAFGNADPVDARVLLTAPRCSWRFWWQCRWCSTSFAPLNSGAWAGGGGHPQATVRTSSRCPCASSRRKTGEMTSRLTSDVATVQAAVSQALAQREPGNKPGGRPVVLFYLDVANSWSCWPWCQPYVAAAFFGACSAVSTGFQDLVVAASSTPRRPFRASGRQVVHGGTVEQRHTPPSTPPRQGAAAREVAVVFVPAVILFGFRVSASCCGLWRLAIRAHPKRGPRASCSSPSS